jgi:hypothetical protein
MSVSPHVSPLTEPASRDVFDSDCPGREILDQSPAAGRTKIGGISEKMLSQSLKTLVRDGLVTRTVEPSVPPKVSYSLTETGGDLTHVLWELVGWIGIHTEHIRATQQQNDQIT